MRNSVRTITSTPMVKETLSISFTWGNRNTCRLNIKNKYEILIHLMHKSTDFSENTLYFKRILYLHCLFTCGTSFMWSRILLLRSPVIFSRSFCCPERTRACLASDNFFRRSSKLLMVRLRMSLSLAPILRVKEDVNYNLSPTFAILYRVGLVVFQLG